MKVVPRPGWLDDHDLAAEQPRDLAADREAEAGAAVLAAVVPSACWNASKMMRCLSSGMPMPVSVTEKAMHRVGRVERSWSALQPLGASRSCSVTPPCSVNLKAFESRF